MKMKTALYLLSIFAINLGFSQSNSVWKIQQKDRVQKSENFDSKTLSANHKFFELDLALLNQILKEAPSRKNTFESNTVILLPNIMGELEGFKISA